VFKPSVHPGVNVAYSRPGVQPTCRGQTARINVSGSIRLNAASGVGILPSVGRPAGKGGVVGVKGSTHRYGTYKCVGNVVQDAVVAVVAVRNACVLAA